MEEPKFSQSVKAGKRHVGLGGAVDLVEWCPVAPGPHPLNASTFLDAVGTELRKQGCLQNASPSRPPT